MNGIGLYGSDFLTVKSNTELVKENIKRILLTLPGEDVGNIEFGCKLRSYLFDFEYVLIEDVEQVITSAITKWEPRVVILGVSVTPDTDMKEYIHITVSLVLRETLEKFNLELPISF